MRVFVYEYLSTGALDEDPAATSLQREGLAMLTAAACDLTRCPGVTVATLLGAQQAGVCHELSRGEALIVRPGEEEGAFRRLARASDWTLVIAPEFDGILAARARWAQEEGSALLGPLPSAIELTADKAALAEHLRGQDIPTPAVHGMEALPEYPLVVKPRWGAGCQATYLIRNVDELAQRRRWLHADSIAQPWVEGEAASIAILAGPGGCVLLPPARQHLDTRAAFAYEGGSIPLPREQAGRIEALARRVMDCVPGLQGYFGLDVVCTPTGVQLIEINPRLTTSYIGLRRLVRGNLMACLLELMQGHAPDPLAWNDQLRIRFFPDGSHLETTS